ncbi:MAG: triose-phosphate isomerase [Thermogutta sp.]|nr:triose-phosphate isomerase [Thermogutta sp.]HOP76452.1 triose-phosphate isomerase [Thermogutta sp.]HPU05997.1 triose-phosphate isomerase [Thermogutta sp.]HQF14155.1 triose-phosphate isomerase [Thermogutta sp.]
MRRPFVAGNWKMNMERASAVALARAVADGARAYPQVDIAVCPPFVYLEAVAQAIAGSPVALGAQNLYPEPKGAFTGEISGPMLKDMGCTFVILGHSERRAMGESSEFVNEKVFAALECGLKPIICVGETLRQRKEGRTLTVVRRQIDGSLSGLSAEQMRQCVIAYEPVWAIGTGENATPDQAEEVQAEIRRLLAERFGKDVADSVRIQYGGSVKASVAADIFEKPNVDGGLIGGASLKADEFLGIVAAAQKVKGRNGG